MGKTSKKTSEKTSVPLMLVVEPLDTADTSVVPEYAELLGVPRLGETRAQALAEIGIKTLADLHAASHTQIGSVKGVGLRNAELIKQWLATQDIVVIPPDPELLSPIVLADLVTSTAETNQAIQDDLTVVDTAISQIKQKLPKKQRDKKLLNQLEKLTEVASDLPEGMDTLTAKQAQAAVRALGKIAVVLQEAGDAGPLKVKEQAALRETLRERRKRLEKALGE